LLTELASDCNNLPFQRAFDALQFTESPVDGNTAISTLAGSVTNKFKERFQAVQRLKRKVERYWTTSPRVNPTECCRVKYSNGLDYDSRLQTKIDLSNVCVKLSKTAHLDPVHVSDSVAEEMKKMCCRLSCDKVAILRF